MDVDASQEEDCEGDDSVFLDIVHRELDKFIRTDITNSVLCFPALPSRLRFLTHRLVEEQFESLCSFSVGKCDLRRTAVCSKSRLVSALENDVCTYAAARQLAVTLSRELSLPVTRPKWKRMDKDGGTAVGAQTEKPPSRARRRRPDMQLYVPRGRSVAAAAKNGGSVLPTSAEKKCPPPVRASKERARGLTSKRESSPRRGKGTAPTAKAERAPPYGDEHELAEAGGTVGLENVQEASSRMAEANRGLCGSGSNASVDVVMERSYPAGRSSRSGEREASDESGDCRLSAFVETLVTIPEGRRGGGTEVAAVQTSTAGATGEDEDGSGEECTVEGDTDCRGDVGDPKDLVLRSETSNDELVDREAAMEESTEGESTGLRKSETSAYADTEAGGNCDEGSEGVPNSQKVQYTGNEPDSVEVLDNYEPSTLREGPSTNREETCRTEGPSCSEAPRSPESLDGNEVPSEEESVAECDSWDAMFDDNGECIDPGALQELTQALGEVEIRQAELDYTKFEPQIPGLTEEEYGHILEVYGFPAEFETKDLVLGLSSANDPLFTIKWVDDTHALAVFSSPIAASEALAAQTSLLKVRHVSEASKQSKLKVKRCAEFLQPFKPRPQTSATVARRLVSGALGLPVRVQPEQRRRELQALKEAKNRRHQKVKQQRDVWNGDVS